MKILVLGLGNELLSDDRVGLLAARRLRTMLDSQAEVCESNLTGIALLDLLVGYDKTILIDAVQTERYAPGTLVEIDPRKLSAVPSPSPHYAGVPEMIATARQLSLPFPMDIKIIAVAISCVQIIGKPMSAPVVRAIAEVIWRVQEQLQLWTKEVSIRS
jgi:hydrogenase maturation protease